MKMKPLAAVILFIYPAVALSQSQAIPASKEVARAWKKDPFSPPTGFVEERSSTSGETMHEPEAVKPMELTAILFSQERSSAVINGNLRHIGDEISGHKILDIQRTYVILGGKNGKSRLELKK